MEPTLLPSLLLLDLHPGSGMLCLCGNQRGIVSSGCKQVIHFLSRGKFAKPVVCNCLRWHGQYVSDRSIERVEPERLHSFPLFFETHNPAGKLFFEPCFLIGTINVTGYGRLPVIRPSGLIYQHLTIPQKNLLLQREAPQPRIEVRRSKIPRFVKEQLVDAAIVRGDVCPISHEPLAKETTVITTCFHLVTREHLVQWFAVKNGICPVCNVKCEMDS